MGVRPGLEKWTELGETEIRVEVEVGESWVKQESKMGNVGERRVKWGWIIIELDWKVGENWKDQGRVRESWR